MAHIVTVAKPLNLIVVSLQGMSFLSGFFIFGILQFHFDVFEISFTYPVWDSLCFLNLKGLIFDQFWKILSHHLIIYCFFCFRFFSLCIRYSPTIYPHVSPTFLSYFLSLWVAISNFFRSVFQFINSLFNSVQCTI